MYYLWTKAFWGFEIDDDKRRKGRRNTGHLPATTTIRVVSAEYFIATKLEAFKTAEITTFY